MVSSVVTRAPRNLDEELARAYDGEVPVPYYWVLPSEPPRSHGRAHPGELRTTLPYASIPIEFVLARAISLEELDERMERRARHEELGG